MAEFVFTARDKAGKLIKESVTADTESSAAKLLISKGLFPITIRRPEERGYDLGLLKRVPTKQKVIFARQLSTMVNAGLPIDQSLSTLAEQITNKTLREAVVKISASVQGGSPLSKALADFPDIFSPVFVTLVQAGEASGTLDKVLLRLATQMEKDFSLASKLRSAAVYPVFVIIFVVSIMIVMTVFVIPKFADFYASFGAELPLPTRIMLGLANFIINFWYLAIAFVVFAFVAIRRFVKTPQGRRVIDPWKLKIPGFSVLIKDIYMARFTRTLGTLISSGVPVIDSLVIVSDTVNNVVIKDEILDIGAQVKRGVALSVPLKEKHAYFPPIVGQMVKVGEQTGELDNILQKLADYYDEEIDNISKNLSSLVEPLLIIVVGGLVFVFIITILLPVYTLVFKIAAPGSGFR